MKHVIVFETATPIGPFQVEDLRYRMGLIGDSVLGEDNFLQVIANQPSAIRGVYRMFSADETQSPDQLQSAK